MERSSSLADIQDSTKGRRAATKSDFVPNEHGLLPAKIRKTESSDFFVWPFHEFGVKISSCRTRFVSAVCAIRSVAAFNAASDFRWVAALTAAALEDFYI